MLEAGDTAPDIKLMNDRNESFQLSDSRGKVVILYFYPKDFTSGCTREACDFRDNYARFGTTDAVVIGISPDSSGKHAKFIAEHELPFRLLADEDRKVMKAYGAWGKKKQYGREYEGVIRSTFLIDRQGTIAKVWKNVRVDGHVDKVLAEVENLK